MTLQVIHNISIYVSPCFSGFKGRIMFQNLPNWRDNISQFSTEFYDVLFFLMFPTSMELRLYTNPRSQRFGFMGWTAPQEVGFFCRPTDPEVPAVASFRSRKKTH